MLTLVGFFYPYCWIFESLFYRLLSYSVHLNVSKYGMFVQYGFVLVGA